MESNELKAGAILNYVVIVLNILVGLLYTPYMLRMMGQSEYGLYSLVASVISYLTVLDLGFGNAIIRYTSKYRAEGKIKEQYELFGMFLILYIIIGIIAFVAGLGLYFNVDNLFGDTMNAIELDHARVMMLILIFNLAITFPMSIFGSIINAYERFVFPRIINISRTVLNTAVMIALLSMGYKAVAMVIVQTIFNILTLVINYCYCKKRLKIQIIFGHFDFTLLKEIAIYSFWIFLNVIMDKIYWSSGQFVLGSMIGTVAVSVFAIAIQLEGMYMMFSTAISSVFLPKVTGLVATGVKDNVINELFIRTGRVQNIVISLILFGFIVFGKQFVILWAGTEYEGAYYMTISFFIALYIPLVQNLGLSILQARNTMKNKSIVDIAMAILAISLEIIFTYIWGAIGCAIAVGVALLVGQGLIMNIVYACKERINILTFWKEILCMNTVPLVISLLFLIITYKVYEISNWGELITFITLYCIIYIPLYYLFSMNQYEKDLLLKPIRRLIIR